MAEAPRAIASSPGFIQPVQMPMGPHRPQVPIPELMGAPFICSLNRQVEMGPVMADAKVGGSQMRGLRTMLPICSMEVPRPWLIRPPQRFSRKDSTAKPTICAQQPATAAPPARPTRPREAQIAAEEMGRVSAMPTMTDTKMPIQNGCRSVAHIIRSPTFMAPLPMAGAIHFARATPMTMVTAGVTRISIFVSLETALPHSAAMMAMIRTAKGPPAPPSALAAQPTATRENSTMGSAFSA